MKKLLVVDVGERMSAEEALGHRWIQESDDFAASETIRVIHKGFCIWTSCPLAPTAVNIVL